MYLLQIEIGKKVLQDLQGLSDTRLIARRAFPAIHVALIGLVAEAFEQQGIPRWTPLADVTVFERLRLGFSAGPILVRTGSLRRSFTDQGNPLHIYRTEFGEKESKLTFGSLDPRAIPLAEGELERNLPARPIFPTSEIIHEELEGTIVSVDNAY